MKATEFVKQVGIDKAKAVLVGAPKIGSYYQEYGVDNNTYYGYDDVWGNWYEYWDIPNAPMWQKVYTKNEFSFNRVPIKELRQVVESLELVNFYGGIEKAAIVLALDKSVSDRPPHKRRIELEAAVKAVQS